MHRIHRAATTALLLQSAAVLACVPPRSSEVSTAPAWEELLTVELAAARQVLVDYRDLALSIHPAFTDSFSTPGRPGPVQRDSLRTAMLARFLGGRVFVAEKDALRNSEPRADLVLSEPRIERDSARINVTVYFYRDPTPRAGYGYHTFMLTLARDTPGWRVIRTTPLGGT